MFHTIQPLVVLLSFMYMFVFPLPQWTVVEHIVRKTISHAQMKRPNTTNRALQKSEPGVNREQRVGSWTVAYQQSSAVPKPPAAVLSSQHEGEGLTEAQTKKTYGNQHKGRQVPQDHSYMFAPAQQRLAAIKKMLSCPPSNKRDNHPDKLHGWWASP